MFAVKSNLFVTDFNSKEDKKDAVDTISRAHLAGGISLRHHSLVMQHQDSYEV